MLRGEWEALEVLSARIEELYHRRGAAEKVGNRKRVHELAGEIGIAERQRQRLVNRITACFSNAA